uniref:SKP1 component dimerisation domain-containing protein n=1 Tax=Ditylenchus dipsaci TaxID=166011 RepID=A0A915DFJ7_9BILA
MAQDQQQDQPMEENSGWVDASDFIAAQQSLKAVIAVLVQIRQACGGAFPFYPALSAQEHAITKERIHFVFTDFEKEFLDVSVQDLTELLMASNYLDIPSLYLYACQRAAQLMTSKTIEEVRADWGFVDDIPEEEKQRILKEHSWCFPSAPAPAPEPSGSAEIQKLTIETLSTNQFFVFILIKVYFVIYF